MDPLCQKWISLKYIYTPVFHPGAPSSRMAGLCIPGPQILNRSGYILTQLHCHIKCEIWISQQFLCQNNKIGLLFLKNWFADSQTDATKIFPVEVNRDNRQAVILKFVDLTTHLAGLSFKFLRSKDSERSEQDLTIQIQCRRSPSQSGTC